VGDGCCRLICLHISRAPQLLEFTGHRHHHTGKRTRKGADITAGEGKPKIDCLMNANGYAYKMKSRNITLEYIIAGCHDQTKLEICLYLDFIWSQNVVKYKHTP